MYDLAARRLTTCRPLVLPSRDVVPVCFEGGAKGQASSLLFIMHAAVCSGFHHL